MSAVPSVHEHVHEETDQRQGIEQRAEYVGPVLGDQENAGNDDEPEQNDAKPHGRERAAFGRGPLFGMIMQRHAVLLFLSD